MEAHHQQCSDPSPEALRTDGDTGQRAPDPQQCAQLEDPDSPGLDSKKKIGEPIDQVDAGWLLIKGVDVGQVALHPPPCHIGIERLVPAIGIQKRRKCIDDCQDVAQQIPASEWREHQVAPCNLIARRGSRDVGGTATKNEWAFSPWRAGTSRFHSQRWRPSVPARKDPAPPRLATVVGRWSSPRAECWDPDGRAWFFPL